MIDRDIENGIFDVSKKSKDYIQYIAFFLWNSRYNKDDGAIV